MGIGTMRLRRGGYVPPQAVEAPKTSYTIEEHKQALRALRSEYERQIAELKALLPTEPEPEPDHEPESEPEPAEGDGKPAQGDEPKKPAEGDGKGKKSGK